MNTQTFSPSNRPIQKPQNNNAPSSANLHSVPVNQQRSAHPEQPQNNQAFSKATPPANNPQNAGLKPNPFKANNQEPDPNSMRQIRAHSYKVHGGKAALEVKPDEKLKSSQQGIVDENGEQNIFYTIRLEAAISNNSGDRSFNWKDKVAIQLTDIELPLFIGVCFGFYEKIYFGNHGVGGEKSSKFFGVEHQGSKVFFQVGQKDKPIRAVPVNLPQSMHIGLMALEIYCKNFPGIDSNTVMNSISNMCGMYISQNRKEIRDKA
ncbi:hypothetical protein AB4263_21210 [Vibrio sp. 10N.261.55.C5]|uniref:hypothetical protein n=1 Tax=Vibrio sp. 10N.261.55.C5 TaxID=3229689 RepID=UPI00354C61B4